MTQKKLYRPSDSKITIYDNNGCILLRFTYKGKPINLSLNLPVTPEKKAIQITNDIIFNTFEEEKYIGNRGKEKKDKGGDFITLSDLLNFYHNLKKDPDSSTLESLRIL
ncbi:hypothetical protein ACN4EE_20085 [Geminocystis sp. CENA526]|uniref:hypothetical protein n=1 Tax=Geminocystis sp. CENA526 TaxID=1355871 RepID=UPI003D6DF855